MNGLKERPVKIRMHKGNIVIAGDDISQGGESLLYSLDLHTGG